MHSCRLIFLRLKNIFSVLLILIDGGLAFAQTNPSPQSIPYTQDFGNNWFKLSALPPGFGIWTANPAQCTSNTNAGASTPTGDDATFDSATVVKSPGKAYGYSGIGSGGININDGKIYLQTSGASTGTDQIVLAINTTGYTNVVASFDVEMINPQPRLTGFVFQYRIATSDPFTTLDSSYWYNVSNHTQNQVDYFVNIALPAAADNQSLVQLRWAMSRDVTPPAAGSCGLGFDNIIISGSQLNPLYFRSANSGNWNAIPTWESSDDNLNWNAAVRIPNSTEKTITIRSPHIINTMGVSDLTVDELVIDGGATLVNAYGTILGVNDGTGSPDLDINGTFVDSSNFSLVWASTARWKLGTNGTLVKTTNTSSTSWQLKYLNGISNIPSSSNWICRKPNGASVEPSISSTNGGPPNTQVYYGNLYIENNSSAWNSTNLCKFSGSLNYPIVKGNLFIGGNGSNAVSFLNSNTNASPLKVFGDVTINAGSTFSVTGTGVELQGNLFCNGMYTNSSTTSKLLFSGTNSQSISGSGAISTWKLEINKPASNVDVNRNVNVYGNLNLLSGRFNTSAASMIIVNDNATSTNASNSSYISGPLQKTGDDAFSFSVGKSGNYQPLAIGALSGVTTTSAFTAEYFDQNPQTAIGSTLGPGIDHISACEYWTLQKDTSSAQKNVTLTYDAGSCGITNLSTLIVARYNSTQWINEGNTGTTGTTSGGTITGTVTTGFGPFTLGSITAENPLPLGLLFFNAKYDGRKVMLKWETASETNNMLFTVQRSEDGLKFENIHSQPGAGNSTEVNSYNDEDAQPLSGISYYRLKQTDYDGNFSFSDVVPVKINEENTFSISIISMWQNGGIQFTGNFQNVAKAHVDITDAAGKIIFNSDISVQQEKQSYFLNLKGASSGVYYFRLYFADEVLIRKFLY